MQDRFKFRAWLHSDVLTPKMVYDIEKMDNFRTWIAQEDKDPVMQCTGLRDKTGKLIFEGDIVIITNINDKNFTEIRQVIFKDCAFQFTLPNSMQIDRPLYCWAINFLNRYKHIEIEVIGNIYENPQLLEEK